MENKFNKIYCEECKKDISVENLDDGVVLIHCPKCVGECLACDCHLAQNCFADAPKVKVLHVEEGKGS